MNNNKQAPAMQGANSQAPTAVSSISMSVLEDTPPTDAPSVAEKWSADELEAALGTLAHQRLAKKISELGEAENLEFLSKQSGWTKTSEVTLMRKRLKAIKNASSAEPTEQAPKRVELSEEDRELGLTLAMKPDLFTEFHEDLELLGFPTNSRFANSVFMMVNSRLLDHSTGHIFTGASSSGKSSIPQAAFGLLPEDCVVTVTAASQNALYYMGDLKGKILAFGEIKPFRDGEDDGLQTCMRQLISEGRIVRSIVEKNSVNKLDSSSKITEGPVVVTASTTKDAQAFNDELANRCTWIQSDDSAGTTKRVLAAKAQRDQRPWENSAEQSKETQRKWRAYNELLAAYPVIIPYANQIIPLNQHVTVRRLYGLLSDYIKCSALAHQHTREKAVHDGRTFVVASPEDYLNALVLLEDNGPRTIDQMGKRAREVFKAAFQTLRNKQRFTKAELITDLAQPRSTIDEWLSQWIAAGVIEIEDRRPGRANIYVLKATSDEHARQNLGLVPIGEVDFDLGPADLPTGAE